MARARVLFRLSGVTRVKLAEGAHVLGDIIEHIVSDVHRYVSAHPAPDDAGLVPPGIPAEVPDELAVHQARQMLAETSLATTQAVPRRFLSMQDFAKRQDVSVSTVTRWKTRGMPARKTGTIVRIPVQEAEAWLTTH
ncbi:unnamed protein product [marine sediment metagenome]|uniref:Helix-turn-helix domain-containing protein n=1 Tax=marine sediment metagenome TaxID=412755 RepID=X0ZB75_9ZZZZ